MGLPAGEAEPSLRVLVAPLVRFGIVYLGLNVGPGAASSLDGPAAIFSIARGDCDLLSVCLNTGPEAGGSMFFWASVFLATDRRLSSSFQARRFLSLSAVFFSIIDSRACLARCDNLAAAAEATRSLITPGVKAPGGF